MCRVVPCCDLWLCIMEDKVRCIYSIAKIFPTPLPPTGFG
jgi:hypothetical protein